MTHTPAAPGADDAEVEVVARAFLDDGDFHGNAVAEGYYKRIATIALAALAPLRQAERERATLSERERIGRRLEEEAEGVPCGEDASVYRSAAALVRADFSYDGAEEYEDALKAAERRVAELEAERERAGAAMTPGAAALCERLKSTERALDTMPRVPGGIVQMTDPIAAQIAADLRAALALIARLTAENERLRAALVPFVEFGQSALAEAAGVWLNGESIPAVTWQFARAALAPAPAEGESDA